jgi:hypothetical protein
MDLFEELCEAITYNDMDRIKHLIENEKVDINQHDTLPLIMASRSDNIKLVLYLVEKGANVLSHEGRWFDRLVSSFNIEQLNYLWTQGARGKNPLTKACFNKVSFRFILERIHESHFEDEHGFFLFIDRKKYLLIKELNYETIFSTDELKEEFKEKFETFPYVITEKMKEKLNNKDYQEFNGFVNYHELSLSQLKLVYHLAPDFLKSKLEQRNIFALSNYSFEHLTYIINEIKPDFKKLDYYPVYLLNDSSDQDIEKISYLLTNLEFNSNYLLNLFKESIKKKASKLAQILIDNLPNQLNNFAFICHKYNNVFFLQEIRKLTHPSIAYLSFLDDCAQNKKNEVIQYLLQKTNKDIENSALLLCLKNGHNQLASVVANYIDSSHEQIKLAMEYENKEIIETLLNKNNVLDRSLLNNVLKISDEKLLTDLISKYEKIDVNHLKNIIEYSPLAQKYFCDKYMDEYNEKMFSNITYFIATLIKENIEPESVKKYITKFHQLNEGKKPLFGSLSLSNFCYNSNLEVLKYVVENKYFDLNSQDEFSLSSIRQESKIKIEFMEYLLDNTQNENVKFELLYLAIENNFLSLVEKYILKKEDYFNYYLKLQIRTNISEFILDYLLDKIYEKNPEDLIKVKKIALESNNQKTLEHLKVLEEHAQIKMHLKKEDEKNIKVKKI